VVCHCWGSRSRIRRKRERERRARSVEKKEKISSRSPTPGKKRKVFRERDEKLLTSLRSIAPSLLFLSLSLLLLFSRASPTRSPSPQEARLRLFREANQLGSNNSRKRKEARSRAFFVLVLFDREKRRKKMPNDPEEEPHAEEEAPTTNTTTATTTEAGTTAPSTTTDPSSKKRKSKKKKRSWLPLESNPEVLSTYARALGAPSSTSFADVYGLDDELLGMVPTPVLALLLLFPMTKSYEDRRIAQEKELKQKKKEEEEKSSSSSTSLPFFTRQTIGNACGTVGLIHLFASIKNEMGGGSDEHKDKQVFEPGSFLERFYEATKAMTPDERAAFLEADE